MRSNRLEWTPFCRVGDVLEVIKDLQTNPWKDEEVHAVRAGAHYRAAGLIEAGWDLERISGEGPDLLRIINSDMKNCVRIVGEE